MTNASRDANFVPVALGVSSVDGVTTLPFTIDPVTGRVLVDSASGSGTVTSVSVVTANGISGSVANATTTPAITLTLNSITILDTNLTIQDDVDPTRQAKFNASSISAGTTRTLSLPNVSDTLVARSSTDTLTNKTFDTAGVGNSFSINGTAITAVTGSGSVVLATLPTLVTPVLGVATATTINGLTITASTGTITLTNAKTLTVSNSITLAGTDGKGINVGAATSGKILIGDGSNMVLSTPTYPTAAGASGNVLTSDGTNWTSATPTAGGSRTLKSHSTATGTSSITVSSLDLATDGLYEFEVIYTGGSANCALQMKYNAVTSSYGYSYFGKSWSSSLSASADVLASGGTSNSQWQLSPSTYGSHLGTGSVRKFGTSPGNVITGRVQSINNVGTNSSDNAIAEYFGGQFSDTSNITSLIFQVSTGTGNWEVWVWKVNIA